VSPLPPSVT